MDSEDGDLFLRWLADDDFTDDELGQLFDLEQPEDVE